MRFTGTISKESPRFREWLEVFGANSVPLLSPLPHQAKGPDGIPQLFYLMDLSWLDDDQRDRLVNFLSRKFEVPIETIHQDMKTIKGLPILAEDLIVAIPTRFVI